MIHIKNITKKLTIQNQKINILQNITLSIKRNEFIAIIGPSGCGKTTLLKIIANLIKPTKGAIDYSKKRKISFVFQEPYLLPWKTVKENILLPLSIQKKAEKYVNIRKLMTQTHLTTFQNAYPYQLSGGMKQKVALARALITNPDILLMDEPFSSLDHITAQSLHKFLLNIHEQKPKTSIFITHNLHEAVLLADKVIVLSKRPAKVKKILNISLQRPRHIHMTTTKTFQEYIQCLRKELNT